MERIARSASPTYGFITWAGEAEMKATEEAVATAWTSVVFEEPGGPCKMIPTKQVQPAPCFWSNGFPKL
jgi:hypothetical protein